MRKEIKEKREYEALVKEYRKLAKRADSRLVRLEGYRHQEGMKGIEMYAYRTALNDIRSWSGEGKKRFNTAPPESASLLRQKIADINKFLNSQTSTYKGVVNMYKKRAEQLNQNRIIWGDNKGTFSWQDYYKIFQVIEASGLDVIRDSRIIIMLATVINHVKGDDLKKAKDKIDYEEADKVQEDIIERLKKQGLDLKEMFK